MAAAERISKQRSSQTSTAPLHTSSVPSTPHQHPRDLRFPSRSPSPSRGLPSRSPRSATAETHAKSFAQRTTPVVCKFETGAEFRKRRIPYKDGGNEPLPPPTKEPKKTLEPHEEDKLSGDMRELYDRLLPSDESEERRAKLIKKLEKIFNDEWPGHDIKVNVFGSSGNLLSSSDSDVDICITTTLKKLESMHGLATVLHQHGMERVVCRAAAKVPIVKIWDPELQLACDMNVNNTQALENTRMIKTYVQIDERVRPLAKIIKYWTKQRILNDAAFGGTISSYTWICMIINFLQTRQPPILPSLQMADHSLRSSTKGSTSQFADKMEKLEGSGNANKESLGHLLFHFFRYYGYELDYQQSVVSVKEGRVLSRKEKGWDPSNYQDKEARVRLCVEEPFNTNRNLGNSADDYAFSGIHEEIRRAFDLIADGKVEESYAEFVFPPEEKPLFQRPVPKPKPTLTRSASQSGRSHANSVGAKGGGLNRNTRTSSSQRGNNRRASSGAAYPNPRFNFMSPQIGLAGLDNYFGAVKALPNDQLHEQLYQQYQYLQAQQELLRNQLMHQQQSHAQIQAAAQAQAQAQIQGIRTTEVAAASPRQRAFAHSLSGSRPLDNPPNTAPLLPGYLYHYPARHPGQMSPLTQTRAREGSMTNPSSPSASATPTLRRNTRGSVPEGGVSAIRSQSQPGRGYPSPVTLQSMVHPGYDVSGAIGTPFLMRQQPQMVSSQLPGYDTVSQHAFASQVPIDSAMPKEYVGYYLPQPSQLLPQQLSNMQQVPILRDMPTRHREPSQEPLPPILPNGSMRRQSRSPPPTQHRRSSSLSTKPNSDPLPQVPFTEAGQRLQVESSRPMDDSARLGRSPAIVNGSTSVSRTAAPPIISSTPRKLQPAQTTNGVDDGLLKNGRPLTGAMTMLPNVIQQTRTNGTGHTSAETVQPLQPLTQKANGTHQASPLQTVDSKLTVASVAHTSNRAQPPPPLNLSPSKASPEETRSLPVDSRPPHLSPPMPPPLLSPVAELQTPSPTSSRGHGSPKNDAKVVVKNVQIANGKLNERVNAIVNGSGSNGLPAKPQTGSETGVNAAGVTGGTVPQLKTGEWQQAPTRKHKKNKSQGSLVGGMREAGFGRGEIMPERESERKGG